ncbi:MAG: DUF393 domain-containing protein [Chitinophagaceae bacterium]|nr:DUF393 domain-containing protein [Chitinophagaceae bacterium]
MKTLTDHQLYYDADCPLCAAYTNAFEQTGLIAKGTRQPFQTQPAATFEKIDRQRAQREIALMHQPTGQVFYGLEAMLRMLFGHGVWYRFFKLAPVNAFFRALYSFVSYNRKVIAPAPKAGRGISCEPPLHRGWRAAYLVFGVVVSAVVLTPFYSHFDAWLNLPVFAYREWYTCIGQLIWQGGLLAVAVPAGRRWNYLGNLMTVSVAGSLMLLPLMAVGTWVSLAPWVYLTWFAAVVLVMLLMHYKRVKLLGLPGWLTYSWVAFRLVWALGLIGWQWF